MNTLVGKSTGIALLMAAAMLAALFAIGVFSATGVQAQNMVMLSPQEPGAAVQITLSSSTTGIMPNQDITIGLPGFSLPATIADTAIDIVSTPDDPETGGMTSGFSGSPTNVVVSGSNITMTVPSNRADGTPQMKAVTGSYSIKIKQSAGITNPASAGPKPITLRENAPVGAPKTFTATIHRVIKLSATSGVRGTMTTATLKGFGNGTATVSLNGNMVGQVMINDNIGTLQLDTSSSSFMANSSNQITAEDASGEHENTPAVFTLSPKVSLNPAETSVSKDVTINLSDWPADNMITNVRIGAVDVTPDMAPMTDSTGWASFDVRVRGEVNRGTQTVRVTGSMMNNSTPSATASLKIGVLDLTAQPTTVVPGQQITIEGSGFLAGDSFTGVTVGGIPVAISPAVTASSAGDIVITVNVPSPPSGNGIGSGSKTISVEAIGSGRVAEGHIQIPAASITLDPENSRRGTTVNVTGTGFPSGDLVQVKYDNNGTFVTVAAGSADASGSVSIPFVVPSYAKIGTSHEVSATSVGVYKAVTASATHGTPGATVTLSSQQMASGQNITITGMNFPAFATVAVMEIGGVDVRPVPAPATSINGDFESTVLVPQLELGNQTVSVRVSSTTITTFLELTTAMAETVTDPADVFSAVGDRLVRVWFLDRETQQWSFYDPDPEVSAFNTLTEVSGGQIVTIIVSEGDSVEFQGGTLFAGSNPVSLH